METETTYVPPEILDDMDEEQIHERMMEVLPDEFDKTEGGFAYDFIRPSAIEKADAMIRLNEAVQLFFPEWAYDEFLDKLGSMVGMTRKTATAAETALTVTGTAGTVIPAGYVFSTAATPIRPNIEFAVVTETTIGDSGSAQVPVRCTAAGTEGNVAAGTIVLMASPMTGISSVTNASAATGGTDTESDEDYSARIVERERSGDASFVGSNADYRRWAMEVDGVGSATVVPLWNGPGTVKLIVMDSNLQPATNTLIQAVYDHIMSDDEPSERLAPIGAALTVVTASLLAISVTAKITLESGYTIETVEAAFTANIQAIFEEAASEGVLRYTRVGSVLSETAGVADYSLLKVNSGTSNVTITAEDYPEIDSVEFTEAGA